MTIRIKFEPRDAWIGLFVSPERERIRLYFCLVPFLPIIVTIPRGRH